jgi:hypothetical protein
MKKIICALLLGLNCLFGYCQTNTTKFTNSPESLPKFIHKLGLHAGTTSGLGLSYKLLIKNKFMIQTVTLPVASRYNKYINSGLSVKYKFRDYDHWDFYAFSSGNHAYLEDSQYIWGDDWETIIGNEKTFSHNFNASGGIAFEYGKGEFFKLGFQIGYGVYNIGKDEWVTNLSIGSTIDFSLNSK